MTLELNDLTLPESDRFEDAWWNGTSAMNARRNEDAHGQHLVMLGAMHCVLAGISRLEELDPGRLIDTLEFLRLTDDELDDWCRELFQLSLNDYLDLGSAKDMDDAFEQGIQNLAFAIHAVRAAQVPTP